MWSKLKGTNTQEEDSLLSAWAELGRNQKLQQNNRWKYAFTRKPKDRNIFPSFAGHIFINISPLLTLENHLLPFSDLKASLGHYKWHHLFTFKDSDLKADSYMSNTTDQPLQANESLFQVIPKTKHTLISCVLETQMRSRPVLGHLERETCRHVEAGCTVKANQWAKGAVESNPSSEAYSLSSSLKTLPTCQLITLIRH